MSADQPLMDDLADVLERVTVGWGAWLELAKNSDVVRVMARYRAAKAEYEHLVIREGAS